MVVTTVVRIFRWYWNGLDEVGHGAQKAVYSGLFGLKTEGLDTCKYFGLELVAVGHVLGPLHHDDLGPLVGLGHHFAPHLFYAPGSTWQHLVMIFLSRNALPPSLQALDQVSLVLGQPVPHKVTSKCSPSKGPFSMVARITYRGTCCLLFGSWIRYRGC